MFIWILEYFNFEYNPFRLFPVHKLTPGPHTFSLHFIHSLGHFHKLFFIRYVERFSSNCMLVIPSHLHRFLQKSFAQSGRLYDRMKRVSNIKLPFVAVNFRSLYVGSMLSLFYCLIAASIFSFNILLHFQFGLLFPISLCSI